MFTTFLSVALFSAAAISGAHASLAVSTPKAIQCKQVEVSWANTQAPYSLVVVPPEDPCDTISDLGDHNGTTMQWLVNVPAGTQVALVVVDSTGEEAWSGDVTVEGSNDTSCLSPAALSSLAAESSSAAKSSSAPSTAAGTTLVVGPSAPGPAGAVESGAPPADGNTSGAAAATAVGSSADGVVSGASALRPATAVLAVAAAALMLAL